MNNETIKKIIEDSYDESKEDALRSLAKDFYSRKLLSTAIAAVAGGILFMILIIFSAVEFFRAGQTQMQIMYAVIFSFGVQGIVLLKIFSWQMILRQGMKRDLKQLELRVLELREALKNK